MNLTARSLNFKADPSPAYWLAGCPVKTFFANALSVFIPSSEKFFIASVRAFYNDIQNEELKRVVKIFFRQEANHSREYVKYVNMNILTHYPTLKTLRFPLIAVLIKLSSQRFRLAMTAAGEHFTAVMSDLQLQEPALLEAAPEEIRALWHWHCIEEIEHRAVAFDVLKTVKTSYFTRCIAFLIMTLFTTYAFARLYWNMMKKDKLHIRWEFYLATFRFLFVSPGYFRKIAKPYFRYLTFSFHPIS